MIETDAVTLQDYLQVVRRRKWMVVQAALLLTLAAVAYSLHQQKRYEASADVLLSAENLSTTVPGTSLNGLSQDPERTTQTQAQVARVPEVVQGALDQVSGTGLTAADFLANSSVSTSPTSDILTSRALFETNVFGSIRMTRAVLPHMREQGSGRIINVSSVLGLVPAPFMALYAATKHAIEGYSESLDHEVREHGVRVLLVEPGYTNTAFDANAVVVDEPLALYTRRREAFDVLTAAAVRAGDEPSVVSRVIVAAATDTRPRLRYPAGTLARRVSKLRRYVPPAIFDKQIRKTSQLAA